MMKININELRKIKTLEIKVGEANAVTLSVSDDGQTLDIVTTDNEPKCSCKLNDKELKLKDDFKRILDMAEKMSKALKKERLSDAGNVSYVENTNETSENSISPSKQPTKPTISLSNLYKQKK